MAIDAFQSRQMSKGSLLLTIGIGVKMTILVALPGALIVLGLASPTVEALQNVGLIIGTQVCRPTRGRLCGRANIVW